MKDSFIEKIKEFNEGKGGNPSNPYTFSLNIRMDTEDYKSEVVWQTVAAAIIEEISRRKLDKSYIIKRITPTRKDKEIVLWTIDLL